MAWCFTEMTFKFFVEIQLLYTHSTLYCSFLLRTLCRMTNISLHGIQSTVCYYYSMGLNTGLKVVKEVQNHMSTSFNAREKLQKEVFARLKYQFESCWKRKYISTIWRQLNNGLFPRPDRTCLPLLPLSLFYVYADFQIRVLKYM